MASLLTKNHLTVRDAGVLLHVSPKRVSRLATKAVPVTSPATGLVHDQALERVMTKAWTSVTAKRALREVRSPPLCTRVTSCPQPLRGEVWAAELPRAGRHPTVILTINQVLQWSSATTGVLVTGTSGPRWLHSKAPSASPTSHPG